MINKLCHIKTMQIKINQPICTYYEVNLMLRLPINKYKINICNLTNLIKHQ